MRIAGLMMALAMAGAAQAQAQTTTVNLEELNLYPERYVGKAIDLQGAVTVASREVAMFKIKGGRLEDFGFFFSWPARDKNWEHAQYECRGFLPRDECLCKIRGTLVKDDAFSAGFRIDATTIDFLKSPK